MPYSIKLSSGLEFTNSLDILIKKFEKWPWENYDGIKPKDLNSINDIDDIDRVYKLGVRAPKQAFKDLIKRSNESISSFLRLLPIDRDLEDIDLINHHESISNIFNIIFDQKSIKIASATKLLHPFRPRLIPVIDSVVENYYLYSASIVSKIKFKKIRRPEIKDGDYVFNIIDLIRDDVIFAREQIDAVRVACKGKPFENISRIRVIESLIWYYYARGESAI